FDGTVETIESLRDKYNPKFGIYTTSSISEIKNKCSKFDGFLDFFNDGLIGRDSIKNLKPAPDGIIKLSKQWGIPCENIIMVGDMEMDILAGKNAGSITVGVTCGFSNHERMNKYGPDFIIDVVSDLPRIVDKVIDRI
ncbi:MAG: HAD hydrolase-like protein, partial [Candidatus Lokiarchaeota archaeon]|nr:HAD hydrolase-like protein [Candidatus Lokiarchaeota archaeon]